jgi:hypothetical protein
MPYLPKIVAEPITGIAPSAASRRLEVWMLLQNV